MAEHAHAFPVHHSHLDAFVDRGLRIHLELLHVSVVHGFRVADDRHRGVV